jgi:hypothetical protein
LGNGGQKRGRDAYEDIDTSRKRSRSMSSFSSVSTISTSRSISPRRDTRDDDRYITSQQSPQESLNQSTPNRKRPRPSSSSSRGYTPESSTDRMGRPRSEERISRPRREFLSPDERGRRRSRSSEGRHGQQGHKSRSSNLDRSQIARHRRSLTPENNHNYYDHDRNDRRRPNGSYAEKSHQQNGTSRKRTPDRPRDQHRRRSPPREKSLSPFSKRLALTQAMNMGR